MKLREKIKLIKSGKLTAEKNVADFGEKIKKLNKELNIYLVLNTKAIEEAKEIDRKIKEKKPVGKLAGLCAAIKSNILVKGLETNCASKVLESWVAPFDATVIEKLKNEDAIILGMVNMDEFACGASGETSAFNPAKNPVNKKLIPGGSSSGSAAAVSAELCDFALGSDTGGSIRNPASHCNATGLKPTYGSVSRYGLIDMAMSFDQIGPITNSVEDAELIFNIIKGQDNFDCRTEEAEKTEKAKKQITISLVNAEKFCNGKIFELIKSKTEEAAKKNKWKIKSVNLPLDIALETYYIIVYTEFFSATRKFDARRFGLKIDDFGGVEVARRILGGRLISQEEYAGKYYRNALKAREYIKEEFERLFKNCDIIILPTVPKLAHKIGESISVEEMYAYDVFTVLANIAGIPAISIPAGFIEEDGMKKAIGIQILAPRFSEELIFKIGKDFE